MEGFGMDQKQQTKSNKCRHNEQGVALIYALVVMAVVFALALALLYGVGQVSIMTSSNRVQEDCYVQALTLSEVIDKALTNPTNKGVGTLYHLASEYMPACDSETIQDDLELNLTNVSELPAGYGSVVIRFQNALNEDGVNEDRYWHSKDLSRQYLDLTVEVRGEKGAKESVTTRYLCCQQWTDADMKYTLDTNLYTGDGQMKLYDCEYVPPTGPNDTGHFKVKDESGATVEESLAIWGDNDQIRDKIVTMEMAEGWSGQEQTISGNIKLRLCRQRWDWADQGDDDEESEGSVEPDKTFKRVYTR